MEMQTGAEKPKLKVLYANPTAKLANDQLTLLLQVQDIMSNDSFEGAMFSEHVAYFYRDKTPIKGAEDCLHFDRQQCRFGYVKQIVPIAVVGADPGIEGRVEEIMAEFASRNGYEYGVLAGEP